MKVKDYFLLMIILLIISVLFVPDDKMNLVVGIIFSALILAIIYYWIRKK